MTVRRAAAVLSAMALGTAVLAGCGDDSDSDASGDSSGVARSSTSGASTPASTSGSAASSTSSPTDGDGSTSAPPFPANTDPDTGQASTGASVTVTAVRVGHHDGFDRVVFEVAGTGTPGWDVRYVSSATSQASGAVIPVAGTAIVQVTLTGVGYPTETGIEEYPGGTLAGTGSGPVTQVVWDTTFEGTSVAFVGTTGPVPFRVYPLADPARVVLEVVDPG